MCVELGPRYEVRERLGQGGFGEVFRVFDRQWGEEVALKRLTRVYEPDALERFLNEYRGLVDVEHPNLVALYQLAAHDDRPYFTMELVRDGQRFDNYVGLDEGGRAAARAPSPVRGAADDSQATESLVQQQPRQAIDFARLERTLKQLVAGVGALHAAGTVHRDIKPANVLVTPVGRVVVLDFGLAAEYRDGDLKTGGIGTLRYMAPEQADTGTPDPASDWYSVGVMLYEALSGRRLCEGSFNQMMRRKQQPPPRVDEIAPEAPRHLAELCHALLQPQASDRPSGNEVASSLGLRAGQTAPRVPELTPIGRSEQLLVLEEAFARSRRSGVLADVRGESGTGKTTLIRHFVERLREREPGLVVVHGRCHPQDATPYKAVDALIVVLSRRLRELERRDGAAAIDELLPDDIYYLARLFPVLRGVKAIKFAARRGEQQAIKDPQERRQRAFAALRELMSRIASRRSLLLFVDDLHWGDVDSARLLVEMMRTPDAPPLLLVVAYRSEDRTPSRCLDGLLGSLDDTTPAPPIDRATVTCAALSDEQAHELARQCLGSEADAQAVAAVARESGGNPFLLCELARAQATDRANQRSADVLEDAIRRRLDRLPPEPRCVVELVCIALRPTVDVIARAANLAQAEVRRVVKRLSSSGMLRSAADERLDLYHQRTRECVLRLLAEHPARLVERHRTIVRILEQTSRGGVEVDDSELAHHYAEAGLHQEAGRCLLRAADEAAATLAFDQAAELYDQRLCMAPLTEADRRYCLEQRAHALGNSGHGVAAAKIFAQLASDASPQQARELLRLAAEQWMRAGHVERGLEVLDEELRRADLRLPGTPRRALLSLLYNRARLRLRGFDYHERDESAVDPERAWRADLLWSVANGLAMADVLRASDYQTRGVIAALETGDPHRIGRALAFEAGFMGTRGINSEQRFARLIGEAQSIAERRGDDHLRGLVVLARGINAYLSARFAVAARLNGEAERLLRGCENASWEIATAQLFALQALVHVGRFDELADRLPHLVREARARGNVYLAASLRVAPTQMLYLARDDVAQAREQVDAAMADWRSNEGFYLMHRWEMLARAQNELYAGEPQAALEVLERRWPELERSQWLRLPLVRVLSLHTRARCTIASAQASRGERRSELLVESRALAARIGRTRGTYGAWARALCKSLQAGVSCVEGDGSRARELLVEAAAEFDVSEIALYGLACRMHRGALLGGDEGQALVSASAARMEQMGVRNCQRMAAMLVPGIG